jgi:DnaK suppressor protein
MMFDLPQPLGPTTPTRLLGKLIEVGSTKDLKPASLILVRRIVHPGKGTGQERAVYKESGAPHSFAGGPVTAPPRWRSIPVTTPLRNEAPERVDPGRSVCIIPRPSTFPESEMPAKKPSAKAPKAKKTVSAKPAAKAPAKPAKPAKPAAKAAPKAKAAPAAKAARSPAQARPAPVAAKRPVPAPKTAGEGEAYQGGMSLLAGPRNVQPYVQRKGEEYMSKEQLEHFRRILSAWKQDLMQEVDRTMLHMKDEAANFPDPNDRATQESEFSLELRTRDRERKLIRKIDEALKRIEDGSYGYCLETGEPIGVKRLEARPVATLSVEAQERRERREKQFGDRDDWYR